MQFNTLPALALLVLGHFFHEAAANSGYAATCNSIRLLDPAPPNAPFYSIVANCEESGGGIYNVDTEINIGSCFGDSGGHLVPELQ